MTPLGLEVATLVIVAAALGFAIGRIPDLETWWQFAALVVIGYLFFRQWARVALNFRRLRRRG